MKQLIIYVHGKGGHAGEAAHYKPLFPAADVIGFDYKAQTPWDAREEFQTFFDLQCRGYDSVILIANSIGAYLSMHTLHSKKIDKALFISPVVDMERLIADMMQRANVTEDTLREKKEIPTAFGDALSWEYLCYVREHPIVWHIPTCILYGEKDRLTALSVMTEFANRIGAPLTVMHGAEHWFHTPEQMAFLDAWVKDCIR